MVAPADSVLFDPDSRVRLKVTATFADGAVRDVTRLACFEPSTLTVQLVDQDTVYTERINQIDLKVSKTFMMGRVSLSPTLEAFNVNNSDAVVSYVSTNVLAASYLRPNSILQGRIIGVGMNLRW